MRWRVQRWDGVRPDATKRTRLPGVMATGLAGPAEVTAGAGAPDASETPPSAMRPAARPPAAALLAEEVCVLTVQT